MEWNLFTTEIFRIQSTFSMRSSISLCNHLCCRFCWIYFCFFFIPLVGKYKYISSHSSSSDIYAHKIIIMTIGQFIDLMNSHLLLCMLFFYLYPLLCFAPSFGMDKWWKPFSSFLNFISIQVSIYTINEPNKQTNK